MALFGRSARKNRAQDTDAVSEVKDTTAVEGEQESSEQLALVAASGRGITHGPWDESEAPDIGAKVDLGAIWIPGINDMSLRMEIDKQTEVMTGTAVIYEGSALQVQAFAAPRTEGIWDEIRAEIVESLTSQNATVDDITGPFGREVLAQIDGTDSEGKKVRRVVRFLGVDGPRWFLRGVISGKAASDPTAGAQIEEVFGNITVLRDGSARAPREVLPMTVPTRGPIRKNPTEDSNDDATDEAPQASAFSPFERGPEITETR